MFLWRLNHQSHFLYSDEHVFTDVPLSLVTCIHGLVAVSLYWVAVLCGFPWKKKSLQILKY